MDRTPIEKHVRSDASVVIRPLPKVVFFYMTWLASLGCALGEGALLPHELGLLWCGVFIFNLIVVSFDFSEDRSLVVILFLGVLGFVLMHWGLLDLVEKWMVEVRPEMNGHFYWAMFSSFSVIFAFVWLHTRVNYWEFKTHEIIHRYGFFGKVKRYRPELVRWDKLMPDVLERILLGTGTMILSTPQEAHPILLEHVVGIGRKDNQIAAILGQNTARAGGGTLKPNRRF